MADIEKLGVIFPYKLQMKRQLLKTLTLFVVLTSCNNNDKTSKNDKQTDNQTTETQVSVTEPNNTENGSIKGNFGGCGYNYTPSENIIDLYEPRPRELSQINSILKFSGLASNFKIYSASIDNAVATIIDNKRYILYDPKLLSYTDIKSGSYWSSMSILAHEIGHHLSGHTITNKGSNPKDELEADKYSGFVLYKLGATLSDATNAIRTLGNDVGSTTHPPKSERIKAITQGWNEANQTRYNGAIPPPPNDNVEKLCEYTSTMLIDKEYIIADEDNSMYGNPDILYGIITEVDKDITRIKIRIVKSSQSFNEGFRKIDGEDWDVTIDNNNWGGNSEMDHSCSLNFSSFFVPGRRMKFGMVEGYPGCGTSEAGHWHLTYAKAVDGNKF